MTEKTRSRIITATVWALRLIVGAVFIASGFAKAIDPWGTVYKIDDYLTVWDLTQPRTLVVIAAMALSAGEFLLGSLLAAGCYRRAGVWLITAVMAVMTPLTLYIWLADPVADCGCFGDMVILSNPATFAKNIVIDLMLIPLLMWNRRVRGLFSPYSQWMAGAVLTAYIAVISLVGYNVQPMIDFRRFAVGSSLLSSDDAESDGEDDSDVSYIFVYERDGERREFTEDAIPDSTWTFVDRRVTGGSEKTADGFSIISDGDDITSDVIRSDGDQVLVVIPDARRVNPSHTFTINELDRRLAREGVSLVTLMAPSDSRGVDWWRDMSMTESPVYTAEPTLLKELVRGNISLVYLHNGTVAWKRTLDYTDISHLREKEPEYHEYPGPMLRWLTLGLAAALLLILMVDATGLTIHSILNRRPRLRRQNRQGHQDPQNPSHPDQTSRQ